MKQNALNTLWRLNRLAVKHGIPILGIACSSDSVEEVIEVGSRAWHRKTGSRKWLAIKPFTGNLRT